MLPSNYIQLGTSLAVQWLRLHASTAGGADSIPDWGTKFLHAAWCGQKKKKIQLGAQETKCGRELGERLCIKPSHALVPETRGHLEEHPWPRTGSPWWEAAGVTLLQVALWTTDGNKKPEQKRKDKAIWGLQLTFWFVGTCELLLGACPEITKDTGGWRKGLISNRAGEACARRKCKLPLFCAYRLVRRFGALGG